MKTFILIIVIFGFHLSTNAQSSYITTSSLEKNILINPLTNPETNSLVSFNGIWSTDYGKLTIIVKKSKATGTYEHEEGKITGDVSSNGMVLTGYWSQSPTYSAPNDAGRIRFTLSSDGNSFTGFWSYGEKEPSSQWNGEKIGDIGQTEIENNDLGIGTTWETTYGELLLVWYPNDSVTGSYYNGTEQIVGKKTGNTLIGRWIKPNSGGKIKFVFEDEYHFKGFWGYGEAVPTSTWDGVMKKY